MLIGFLEPLSSFTLKNACSGAVSEHKEVDLPNNQATISLFQRMFQKSDINVIPLQESQYPCLKIILLRNQAELRIHLVILALQWLDIVLDEGTLCEIIVFFFSTELKPSWLDYLCLL